jgi:pimeloyl-ACP methyl ester carboxylesterase
MARKDDYRGIMLDTAERSYSEKRLEKARLSYRFLGSFGKPKSFDRFLIQAASCLSHDAYGELPRIACPTLVIGGTDDRIVTGAASEKIAAAIPGAQLYLYEGLGHGLYEEAPDFLTRVADFCR